MVSPGPAQGFRGSPSRASIPGVSDGDVVERVREICLALPEAVEKSFGGHTSPAFRVRDKMFVMISEDRTSMTFKGAAGVQEALVAGDPDRFYVPPYVGAKGWVGARLGARPGLGRDRRAAGRQLPDGRAQAPRRAGVPPAVGRAASSAPRGQRRHAALRPGPTVIVAPDAGRLGSQGSKCFLLMTQLRR